MYMGFITIYLRESLDTVTRTLNKYFVQNTFNLDWKKIGMETL